MVLIQFDAPGAQVGKRHFERVTQIRAASDQFGMREASEGMTTEKSLR